MKRIQILLFIFCTIALLTVLCAFFPKDGVRAGKITLRFPTITEMLEGDKESEEVVSPEEIIKIRHIAAQLAKKSEMERFFKSDPARFYLPEDDISFFDALFASLDKAEIQPVRVVHYGDSQIEEDRITGTIRTALQSKFGGSGPGMMPVARHFTAKMGAECTPELESFMVFANRAEDNKYGPYGDFVRLDTTATATYFQVRNKEGQSYFDRVTLLAGKLSTSLSASSNGIKKIEEPGAALSFLSFDYPDSSTKASLTISGKADLYGVLLDSEKGVRVDNVPMRGCAGTVFTMMNAEQLRAFYNHENVRLILLQYGGNSVPYLSTDKAISSYCSSIERQILYLKKNAPKAKIIFIGPSDMATVINGKRQTYPKLASLVDSLKASSNSAGAAYWDMYGSMGGSGSMIRWVSSKPALAGSDYIHFTLNGSATIGEMFKDSFLLYYEYYKLKDK